MNIAAIILAAGRSRRMGTQKLLLPLAGQTVIGHIFNQIANAGIGHIYVVTCADRQAIAEALDGRNFTFVENPNTNGDMLSSIRCGLQALPANTNAALICLGDQPGIETALIVQLIQLYNQSKCGITLPMANGKRGHPVVLSSKYFADVLANFDGVGLQGLLQDHPADICFLAIDDPAQLSDMDYPPDYERAVRNLGGSTHGSP